MNRRFGQLVSFALLSALIVGRLSAQELSIDTGFGNPGETVIMAVSYVSEGSVVGIQFVLTYDPSLLSPGDAIAGSALSDHVVDSRVDAPGSLRVAIHSPTNAIIADGGLLMLALSVDSEAAYGFTALTLQEEILGDGQALAVPAESVASGGVEIVPPGCLAPFAVFLTAETLTSNEVIEACQSITVGPDVSILPPAKVTLLAGEHVELIGPFSVHAGAELTVEISGSPAFTAMRDRRKRAAPWQAGRFEKSSPVPPCPGDPTGDETRDGNDVAAIVSHILGESQLTGDALIAADVNADGEVDILDLIRLTSHINGEALLPGCWIALEVTPAAGGAYQDPASGFAIDVPPGAVAETTVLLMRPAPHLETLPVLAASDESLFAGPVWELLPAGQTFLAPVTLALPVRVPVTEPYLVTVLLSNTQDGAGFDIAREADGDPVFGVADLSGLTIEAELERFPEASVDEEVLTRMKTGLSGALPALGTGTKDLGVIVPFAEFDDTEDYTEITDCPWHGGCFTETGSVWIVNHVDKTITRRCVGTFHLVGHSCNDVPDTEPCADPGCDGVGTCLPGLILEPAEAPCDGVPSSDCANPECDGNGNCVPIPEPAGEACDEVADTEECANPGCDGNGSCVPAQIPEPHGSYCIDAGFDCWIAGCSSGVCDQQFAAEALTTPCSEAPDNEECANPGCDGAGTCVSALVAESDGFPCSDTGLDCWLSGCLTGVCEQQYQPEAFRQPCTEAPDPDECADPGCDGGGSCVSALIPEPDGRPCTGICLNSQVRIAHNCQDSECVEVGPVPCALDEICILGLCAPDPTYVIPLCDRLSGFGACRTVGHEGLAMPFGTSLVRGEIPIDLNLPPRSAFELKILANDGSVVHSCHGRIDRPFDADRLAELVSATKTPLGNACNWDTGLTAYSYGDQYGPDTHGRLGRHRIVLDALTPNGRTVIDAIDVYVANVATFVYGGTLRSDDGLVRIDLQEHSIDGAFQLVMIENLGTRSGVEAAYRLVTPQPRFLAPGRLGLDLPGLSGRAVYLVANQDELEGAQPLCGTWQADGTFVSRIESLPATESLLLVVAGDPPPIEPCVEPDIESWAGISAARDEARDIVLDFEGGLLGAAPQNRYGANVSVSEACPSGRCLRLRNQKGGSMGTSLLRGRVDLRRYPRLSFSMRTNRSKGVNLQARVNGQWYEFGLDDENRDYHRVNTTFAGAVQNRPAEGRWTRINVDLLRELEDLHSASPTLPLFLEQLSLGAFESTGYLTLRPGRVADDATILLDDLVLHREAQVASRAHGAVEAPDLERLLVDHSAADLWTQFHSGSKGDFAVEHSAGSMTLSLEPTSASVFAGLYAEPRVSDWQAYDALRFKVRSIEGHPRLSVSIKDADEHQASIRVAGYEEDSGQDWQTVTIPRVAFTRIDLASVRQLALTLDAEFDPENQRLTVCDFELVRSSSPDLLLGRFSSGLSAWGAAPRVFASAGARISATPTSAGTVISVGEVRSQRYRESWSGWSVPLPGVDGGDYDHLSLQLRRLTGAEVVNLYLRDATGGEAVEPLEPYLQDHSDWQLVRVPLERFRGARLDIARLTELVLAFEWKAIDGALMVDEIRMSNDNSEQRHSR